MDWKNHAELLEEVVVLEYLSLLPDMHSAHTLELSPNEFVEKSFFGPSEPVRFLTIANRKVEQRET